MKIFRKIFISSGLILVFMFVFAGFTQAQSAATKKAASKNWNSFWTKFSTAVKNKDRKTFIALTRKGFFDAGGSTIEEWIDNVSWSRLRSSVNKGTKDYSPGSKIVMRITKNRDLIFEYGKNGWRFLGELVA